MGNPFVPLAPPIKDPLQQYAQMMSLRALGQEQQLRQQQMQMGQLQMQQMQMQVNRTKALNDAFANAVSMDPTTGQPTFDRQKVIQSVAQSGQGAAIPDLNKSFMELDKLGGEVQSAKDAHNKAALDYMGALAKGIKDSGYDPTMAGSLLAHAAANGYANEANAVRAKIAQNPELLKPIVDQILSQSPQQQQLATSAEQAATAQWKPVPNSNVLMNVKTGETKTAGPGTPGMQEAQYRNILAKIASHQPVSPAEMAAAKAYEASQSKTTSQSDTLGVTSTNVSRPSGLAALRSGNKGAAYATGSTPTNPSGSVREGIVDAIGQYTADPMMLARLEYRHPEIIGLVKQKYPDWNQAQYNAINQTVKELAPGGAIGKQLTSYNAFIGHVGDLWDAISSLKNSNLPAYNKPMNYLRTQSGDPRVKAFLAKTEPVLKEFESFLLNNRALYSEDRADAQKLFSANDSPAQMQAVLQSLAHTGTIRLNAQNDSFKRVTGRDIPNLIPAESQSVLRKIGQGGGGGAKYNIGDTRTYQGGTYKFDGQQWVRQ